MTPGSLGRDGPSNWMSNEQERLVYTVRYEGPRSEHRSCFLWPRSRCIDFGVFF